MHHKISVHILTAFILGETFPYIQVRQILIVGFTERFNLQGLLILKRIALAHLAYLCPDNGDNCVEVTAILWDIQFITNCSTKCNTMYQYNFRAEQRVSNDLIGRAVPYMMLYKPLQAVYVTLYNNQINARALIGQSAVVYCAGKPTEKSRVF